MKSLVICDPMFPAFQVSGSLFGSESPFDAFERLLGAEPFFPGSVRAPAVDVRESAEKFTIVAELPGLTEKDLKLEVKDRVLSLSVEQEKAEDRKDEAAWIRRERREFAFSRRFSIPENADVDGISARFKDGLLTVELPKKPATAPRVVAVNAA